MLAFAARAVADHEYFEVKVIQGFLGRTVVQF